ncbi:hypothetical protein [Winogradskyella luteola]|uniref:Uncharacterized protein n=1 Tax=Winogradskyella luteola TaxID=2828330 RepID=A0A9X1FAV8_9FLAO|nr:hypothetical protein [Winogradskyella luteola]MBV7270462.1 hypothetical protein [Winogradskyella luteola]
MMYKIFRKSIVLTLFISVLTVINAQELDINLVNLNTVIENSNDYSFYNGEIHLKTNETLKGRISLNHINDDQYAVLLKTDKGHIYVSNKDVNSVILFDENKGKILETKFVSFDGHDKLFRELYIKDDETAIYDSMEKPFDNKIMSGVYVLEDDELKYIYNFWSSGPKKDIINYINERDDSNYKRRDFKSLNDLFAIL